MMIEILRDEEGHIDWLEMELISFREDGPAKLSASTDPRRRLSRVGRENPPG